MKSIINLKNIWLVFFVLIILSYFASVLATDNNKSSKNYRQPNSENILYLDIEAGRLIIELYPELAPLHVSQIKTLVNKGFYDGLIFHRVIEGFMAQGGDPTGTGAGGSDLPDIKAEFTTNKQINASYYGQTDLADKVGFYKTMPIATLSKNASKVLAKGKVPIWGMHCQGVVSMARSNSPNSANSQFFIVFKDARMPLDKNYTVWGRVVYGTDLLNSIKRGEPPANPTKIIKAQLESKVDKKIRTEILIENTNSNSFKRKLMTKKLLSDNNKFKDICSIQINAKLKKS